MCTVCSFRSTLDSSMAVSSSVHTFKHCMVKPQMLKMVPIDLKESGSKGPLQESLGPKRPSSKGVATVSNNTNMI